MTSLPKSNEGANVNRIFVTIAANYDALVNKNCDKQGIHFGDLCCLTYPILVFTIVSKYVKFNI